ncbi:hypothetical protein DSO57_1033389, partial [Entomophthora muscae]
MKEIHSTPPLPNEPPDQDFSKLEFIYITVLELANQVVPHTGSWRPLATAVKYIVRIAPIVYMTFQARPASTVGVQPDSIAPPPASPRTINSVVFPKILALVVKFLVFSL